MTALFVWFIYSSVSEVSAVYAAKFAEKSAANETLSDEFCELVVEIFKSNLNSEEFADKMLEYIKEF